ncbi:oxidoreductase [Chitinophaga caeni]|uniref:Oxidoreductase n=1 Tax=Chitinophaga caeni TaxID=2029983 RepID=A0A291QSQ5_9BACT|nr:NADP-dependent oxidoreductase [Chitinophaga caeni]ATL46986.1 oxidoreductase [Chitinophaga caeni]
MKAILLQKPGGTENFEYQDIHKPAIHPGEVLIEVKAISINPVDIKTRMGKGVYGRIKDESPLILGWDVSGLVVESLSDEYKAGDEVFGMIRFPGHGKAYAEYVAAPAAHLAKKPGNVSHEEAVAATLAALTAYQVIVEQAQVKDGQKVLIHAASGGVGHYAVQVAKSLGAYVIGTSSEKNRDFVLGLGADEHIDYHTADLDALKDIDFALDALGDANVLRTIPLMKKGGTIISIPSGLGQEVVEAAKVNQVNAGFSMVQSSGENMKAIADLLANGTLRSHVSTAFSFDDITGAHQQIESGRTVGKIVLTF